MIDYTLRESLENFLMLTLAPADGIFTAAGWNGQAFAGPWSSASMRLD